MESRQTSHERSAYVNLHLKFLDHCAKGHYIEVKEALQCNSVDITYADYDDRTALHVAAERSQSGICRLLMDHKAPLNVRDRWGAIPAYCATSRELREMFKAAGVKYDEQETYAAIVEHANNGDKDGVVRCLMAGKGKAAKYADYDDRTALHLAACMGHIEIVKLLLSNGASPHARDHRKQTPIDNARVNGHMEIVKIMENHKPKNSFLSFLRISD